MATLNDVNRIALSLPHTTAKTAWGTPAFYVKNKMFSRIRSEAEGGLVAFVADIGEKHMLVAADPKKFYSLPHYDNHASVLVRIKAVGKRELRELLTESWRLRAPKRVLQEFDASR